MSAGARRWTTERLQGPVSYLLEAAEPPEASERLARIHTVTEPALVLGSTQGLDVADSRRAAAAGAEVVRRRSGGGAVLLRVGGQVWVDFYVPVADPLWADDVARAVQWVGELWADAIEPFVTEPVSVHSGRLEADRWGKLVCFAGRGSGEVFAGGLKVVGVSQRRSRRRARIQTAARLETRGDRDLDELDLLDVAPDVRAAGRQVMAARCGAIPATEADLTEALLRTLHAGT